MAEIADRNVTATAVEELVEGVPRASEEGAAAPQIEESETSAAETAQPRAAAETALAPETAVTEAPLETDPKSEIVETEQEPDEVEPDPAGPTEPGSDTAEDAAAQAAVEAEDAIKTPVWKIVTAIGAWVTAIFFLIAMFSNLAHEEPVSTPTLPILVVPVQPIEVRTDSLGFQFDEVRDLWNSLDVPPKISKPLVRSVETGEMDSFLYRLNNSAELVGAYFDNDDYVVALVVRANIKHPKTSSMYLHLCHMLHPFTPECLDNYFDIGLAGMTLEELAEEGSEISWEYQGNEWRVTVEENLLTLRILAPDSN